MISRQGHKSKFKFICEYVPIWQIPYFRNIPFWQFLEDTFKKDYVINLFQYENFYDGVCISLLKISVSNLLNGKTETNPEGDVLLLI